MSDLSYCLQLNLEDFRDTSIAEGYKISPDALEDGQVLVRVDKLALTSNSISYVIAGKSGLLPYLDLFPSPAGSAQVPCWGYADVVHSKHSDVLEGERLYGFFPIASHVILAPGKITERQFTDTAPHRAAIAPFYNEYSYARREPGYAPAFEDTIMLFRPLFGTSYLLQSFLEDHDFFGAQSVVISSASAKTAMGFGYLLRKHHGERIKVIGITSRRNKDFVMGLNAYDSVLTYDEIEHLEKGQKTAFFDVAGNSEVAQRVHLRLGDSIKYSGHVGQTHWDAGSEETAQTLPGAPPAFWSGPDQVMALRERHGAAGMGKLIQAEMIEFLTTAYGWINTVPSDGAHDVEQRLKVMLDGQIKANEGVVLRP